MGLLGVSLAFGLTVVTMAYAVGHVSGAHFNPAVTIGLWAARRFDNVRDAGAYIVAQIVGGLLAGAVLWGLAKSVRGAAGVSGGLAANGYGEHSPGGFSLVAVLLVEILLTAFFVFVILGVTTAHAPTGFAPLAIGLTLTLIHLISIPIDNTSVNPARSLGVAFFNGNGAPGQVWLFIVAPIVGAVIAGWTFEAITGIDRSNLDIGGAVNPGEVMTEPAPATEVGGTGRSRGGEGVAGRGRRAERHTGWSAPGSARCPLPLDCQSSGSAGRMRAANQLDWQSSDRCSGTEAIASAAEGGEPTGIPAGSVLGREQRRQPRHPYPREGRRDRRRGTDRLQPALPARER